MSQAGTNNSGVFPPFSVAQTLTGNNLLAVPPDGANNIFTLGGNNITVTGNPGTFTLTWDVTGTTNHSLLLGNASGSLSNLGVATDGQLPIGSTGADPVLATLTAGAGINILNAAGSITISSFGIFSLNYTLVNTTPYVVLNTDEYLGVDSSGGIRIIQLPNAPATGKSWIIKDRSGSANTNNITVTTVGGAVLIDAAATYVMNTQYAAISVIFNGIFYEIW